MKRIPLLLALAALLLAAGCSDRRKDIVIVEKTLQWAGSSSTAIPEEMGSYAVSQNTMYFITGKVTNTGEEEARNVMITFGVRAAEERRSLTATIASIPPGATVAFTTDRLESRIPLKLGDDAPEVYLDR